LDLNSKTKISKPKSNVLAMQLSPKGTYLVSVNKVDKDKSAITIF